MTACLAAPPVNCSVPVNSEQEDDNAKYCTTIEQASGTSYNRKKNLFSAGGMWGQGFPFYTDGIIIVM